jgi:hypothetical protein
MRRSARTALRVSKDGYEEAVFATRECGSWEVTQYSAVQCLDTQHAGGTVTVGNGACVGVALYPDVW